MFHRNFTFGMATLLLAFLIVPLSAADLSSAGNRFTYLDSADPFYVHRDFPKLTTPQWIGEPGVEAVVILAIDDMREPSKYETFLRPALERLKKIDGRAPVSILANQVDPKHPQLQTWLKEGLSIDVHTMTHPCPCLANGNFNAAAATYNQCVDLLSKIPGNLPVAFRMPCCDSMNSPSPRFYAEIFPQVTSGGKFLGIDSSVMVLLTTNDPALPRELVSDPDGSSKFRKYFPTQTNKVTRLGLGSFATYIEDYPYPYVINKVCWEFPCMVPSDWEAQNVLGPNSPGVLADWKSALDATVLKQGVFTMIFHPHGWCKPEQLVEFVDYAQKKHGSKVKFLNFREAYERLNQHLLAGNPLRDAAGQDSGVRLLDINHDGFLDVFLGATARIWQPRSGKWEEVGGAAAADDRSSSSRAGGNADVAGPKHSDPLSPSKRGEGKGEGSVRSSSSTSSTKGSLIFGVLAEDGKTAFLAENLKPGPGIRSDALTEIPTAGLQLDGVAVRPFINGVDEGVRLRDIDRDGVSELIVGNPKTNAIFRWDIDERTWKRLPYALPAGTAIVDVQGRDAGLRFVDVNGDGYEDVLFSNPERYSLHLFISKPNRLGWKVGWNDEIVSAKREGKDGIPMIVRGGPHPNNGVWFKNQTMWIQNEDTAHLPDKVDRRTFQQLLQMGKPKPLSPQEALKSMRVRPGFTIELVASEPLVRDPIAFEWGADGKLWVVEMGDYPSGVDGKGQPGGAVKFLEDHNGDGRYDKATAFLENIPFPTGVFPWGRGVIVSAAPDIFYAEDTNGDGKADQRKVLWTGFVEGNQQHRVNGFEYGLDGWLYCANGDSGGEILPGNAPAGTKPIKLRQHDFRFHPDSGRFQTIPGQTQFGRRRDDWGNWFGNNNPTWLWHYHFPDHYLARNPSVALKANKQMLANRKDGARCFPASRTLQRFNDFWAYNLVTSGNSPTPYRDELFGPEFATSVFISEPVHNLVHREVLEPDGVTFKSHRAKGESTNEFLASTDNWFRPIMLKTGPDGALYVADMYRAVIEHPEWIPQEVQQHLDLRAGHDMGRIYRVYPTGMKLRPIPRLDQLSPLELIAALDSPNGWQRDTAQRLLLQGSKKPSASALARWLESDRPVTRLQALWTLSGLDALTPTIVLRGLSDAHPSVREAAVQLSEKLLRHLSAHQGQLPPEDQGPASPLRRFEQTLPLLARDPSPRVRYQLAFSLGEWNDARAGEALAEIALQDAKNESIQTAVLSSAVPHASLMLARLKNQPAPPKLVSALQKLAASKPAPAAAAYQETVSPLDPEFRKEREAVLKQYAKVAELSGNPAHGLKLYEQNCSTCHRFRNQGHELGPALGTVSGKPLETLLTAILDPNQAVEARYLAYTAVSRDGEEATGLLLAETPTSITLRLAGGLERVVLKQDLKELRASKTSLMPEGLEKAFTPQDMADLISALRMP